MSGLFQANHTTTELLFSIKIPASRFKAASCSALYHLDVFAPKTLSKIYTGSAAHIHREVKTHLSSHMFISAVKLI